MTTAWQKAYRGTAATKSRWKVQGVTATERGSFGNKPSGVPLASASIVEVVVDLGRDGKLIANYHRDGDYISSAKGVVTGAERDKILQAIAKAARAEAKIHRGAKPSIHHANKAPAGRSSAQRANVSSSSNQGPVTGTERVQKSRFVPRIGRLGSMQATPKSQRAMYDETSRELAEINETFLELLPTMRRRDLERLIERRPTLWNRFASYLTSGHVFVDDPPENTRHHHATKKSPAQLQREIDEALAKPLPRSYEEDMEALEKKHAGVIRGGSLRAGHAPVVPKMPASELTRREKEVLQGFARGFSYPQVARELNISNDTIRSHVRALFKKLGVQTMGAAVERALHAQLI